MNFDGVLAALAERSAKASPMREGDYMQDGILHCGKCHTAKQYRISDSFIVSCLCKCESEKRDEETESRRLREKADKIASMKSVAIADKKLRSATFATADGRNAKQMDSLKRYCEKWPDMQKENIGLILYGNVGSGKSYAAACVANEIMTRYTVPVLMTNFSRIFNALSSSSDKNAYIHDIVKYPLLILDDFGIERSTGYAMEQVYNVIDARYRTEKPLIITTNIPYEEIKNPTDVEHARIYSRIEEMCIPCQFASDWSRADANKLKREIAAKMFAKEP